MNNVKLIKNFYGQICGKLEFQPNGDVLAKDFYGKILGRYIKSLDVTKNFYGQIVSKGDITSALVWEEYNKHPF